MLDYVALYFILTGGSGYRAPLDVYTPACGKPGLVVGLLVDRLVNPRMVLWPDPKTVGEHCEVDVAAYVLALETGEYENCTTEMGKAIGWDAPRVPYIGIDPHCSLLWRRDAGDVTPPSTAPTNFQLRGQQ
jgi:hypothetical protein